MRLFVIDYYLFSKKWCINTGVMKRALAIALLARLALIPLAAGCVEAGDGPGSDAPIDMAADVVEWFEIPVDSETIVEGLEICNGEDDDENGLIDDGTGEHGELIEACSTECGEGFRSCFNGEWWPCSAPETNPDGTCSCEPGDERSCETPCGVGTQTCEDEGFWGVCSAGSGGDEICDNGIDDDCDGSIDEGDCGCLDGDTKECGDDTGECRGGTQTCHSGEWGECTGQVGPMPEQCNGLDDDCDDIVDNNIDGDRYETNNECSYWERIPDAVEDGVEQAFEATLAPAGDVDWFKVHTVEGSHVCVPFTGQCCFELRLSISVTEGPTPKLCYYLDDCGTTPDGCTGPGENSVTASYSGTCSYDDGKIIYLQITEPDGEINCHEYTVRYRFVLND